ncbi:hypothetical protein KUTeg_001660 [Tegillarca granosa]|uniref:Acetyl-CoA hydrolase/transferase C-terminal domain-containing protein n=1 Tax=Tegillarca granosa TaxID=220873 RepID=A0ABQ9FS33_TEGGR|nr:hypothetical protein KUTeg_001660 [Tegillarca granosa]
METQNDNPNDKGLMETQNDKGLMETLNDNANDQGLMETQKYNPKDKGLMETQNDNPNDKGLMESQNDNPNDKGLMETQKDKPNDKGLMETLKDSANDQGLMETQSDNPNDKLDVALVSLSKRDTHGFYSLGTSVDCTRSAIQNAKYIIDLHCCSYLGLVNKNLPRTLGDGMIHESHLDAVVEADDPLPELKKGSLTEQEEKIGKIIADNLVENGATLQMGIGSIPDAVLAQLTGHKDLGVHSEMFSDGVMELVENGNITNEHKNILPGKIVSSFAIGTKKLYDFMDNNPFVEMCDVAFTNNTAVICQNPKVTAINSCIEVDLTGQVCADSIGERMYSGSGVVTTRAHVHYIVTEWGIAYLFGKNLRQRAYALINIAHPNHREVLEKAAFERLKCMPSP